MQAQTPALDRRSPLPSLQEAGQATEDGSGRDRQHGDRREEAPTGLGIQGGTQIRSTHNARPGGPRGASID